MDSVYTLTFKIACIKIAVLTASIELKA